MPADAPRTYRFADFAIASDFVLPELRTCEDSHPSWRIHMGAPGTSPPPMQPGHEWRLPSGERSAWFGEAGARLVLHFARTATFVVDPDEGEVIIHPVGRASAGSITPALVNQVMPLLVGLTRLVLHASAVVGDRGAVAFAGPPGRGKSTLALHLAMHGYALLTDDCLILDADLKRPLAIPSGLDARLWPDSVHAVLPGAGRWPGVRPRAAKQRIRPRPGTTLGLATSPAPLRRLYLLSDPEDRVAVSPVPTHEAVVALTSLAFLLEVGHPGAARQVFERVTTLLQRVSVRRLTPTRHFGDLPALRAAIERD